MRRIVEVIGTLTTWLTITFWVLLLGFAYASMMDAVFNALTRGGG